MNSATSGHERRYRPAMAWTPTPPADRPRSWVARHKIRTALIAVGVLLAGFWALGVAVGPPPEKHKAAPPAATQPATTPAPAAKATTAPPPAATTKAPPPPKATKAAPAPKPTTHTDPAAKPGTACFGQQWPQPVPDVVGRDLSSGTDPLLCYQVAAATAPDGHDVMQDPGNTARLWTITAMNPRAGTPVEPTTPITLTVAPR
ncbi:PASTA domain-containing protein [Embleya sp. NPDC005971]|uniref:PASTA domain-containing protein n=1 Tax=Embleya sp. NPDC005971 TaxID=3156724 RepID=UPI0033CA27FD